MRIPFSLSLAKTGTFAVLHFVVAFTIAYLLTGSFGIASAIALIEPAANTVAYLLHERAWARFTPTALALRSRLHAHCCGWSARQRPARQDA